jgi:succinate dehydrogenase / fumarate reductase iron-sulfur subunit
MEHYTINLNLKVWRQSSKEAKGSFKMYRVENISSEMSFLEIFAVLNEQLI